MPIRKTRAPEPWPPFDCDPSLIAGLLHKLSDLRKFRAGEAGITAEGKDKAACEALAAAALLVNLAAGWALNHQRGLAVSGLRPAVGQEESSSSLDSHEHEKSAAYELSPLEGRRYLLNLLLTMGGGLGVPKDVIEAVEALDFGQLLPPLDPGPNKDRLGLTTRRARLAAIVYVEYEHAKTRVHKERIWEDVAKAFATNRESMKDWRTELRKALGQDHVNELLRRALIAGKEYCSCDSDSEFDYVVREMHEETYGTRALQQAAEIHRRRGE